MKATALLRLLLFAALTLMPVARTLADDGADTIPTPQRHSLTFTLGGGLHSLNAQFTGLDYNNLRPGGLLAIDYDIRLSGLLSLGTGIGLATYGSTTETTEQIVTSGAIDKDGESYVHTLSLTNVAERQTAFSAELPLRLTFHFPVAQSLSFFVGAQLHANILLADRYKVTSGQISTTGYYSQYHLTFDADMPENGFYSISPSYTGSAGLRKVGVGLGARVGLCKELTSSLGLNVGLYGRYSISDLAPSDRGAQFDPDCLSADGYNARYRGALASSACTSVHPLAVGLSVGLRLSFGRRYLSAPHAPKSTGLRKGYHLLDSDDDIHPELAIEPKHVTVVTDSLMRQIDIDIQSLIDQAGGIRFDLGSGALLGESADAVARIAEILNSHPSLNVSVTGHTCDVGTPEANLRIGRERAEAVARCLERNGVDDSRIRTYSAGDTQPIAPNDTEEHRALNRRVKIVVVR